MLQTIHHEINFILCFEKKKKAKPTIPYIFMNIPKTMHKAAHLSFSLCIKTNDKIIIPVKIGLNCCPKIEVINSFKQIIKSKLFYWEMKWK